MPVTCLTCQASRLGLHGRKQPFIGGSSGSGILLPSGRLSVRPSGCSMYRTGDSLSRLTSNTPAYVECVTNHCDVRTSFYIVTLFDDDRIRLSLTSLSDPMTTTTFEAALRQVHFVRVWRHRHGVYRLARLAGWHASLLQWIVLSLLVCRCFSRLRVALLIPLYSWRTEFMLVVSRCWDSIRETDILVYYLWRTFILFSDADGHSILICNPLFLFLLYTAGCSSTCGVFFTQ